MADFSCLSTEPKGVIAVKSLTAAPWNGVNLKQFEMQPPIPSATELLNRFADAHLPDPAKEVEALTGDEKTALCIKSGVPMKLVSGSDAGILNFRTSVRVGFIKAEGKFVVMQENPHPHGHGHFISFRPLTGKPAHATRPPASGALPPSQE